jgi:hypothetical protein
MTGDSKKVAEDFLKVAFPSASLLVFTNDSIHEVGELLDGEEEVTNEEAAKIVEENRGLIQ